MKVNVKFEVHIINSLSRESLAFRVWFWCASTSCETVDVYNSFSSMDKVFSTVITCIAIPMYVCNVLGNFLVIVVIQKDKKLRESPNTFLLLSLAHSDIWFSILAFVNVIFISKQATYAVREFFMNALASIYILVALAVERYFAILRPFVHLKRARQSLLSKVVLVIWLLAVVLSAPGYYIAAVRKGIKYGWTGGNTTLNETWVEPLWFQTFSTAYALVLFIFGYIFPSAVIIFCYLRVIYHVWFNADSSRSTQAGLVKSRRKITKLFILVTVVFTITWTPTFVELIVAEYGEHSEENMKLELFSMLLGLTGSAANPLIYSFRSPKFRREVCKLLTCNYYCKKKIRQRSNKVSGAFTYKVSLPKMESKRENTPVHGYSIFHGKTVWFLYQQSILWYCKI